MDGRSRPRTGEAVRNSIVCIEHVPSLSAAKQFEQTVNEQSEPIGDLIEGVIRRESITHPDDRGTLTEIFNPAWNLSDEPLVYVYQVTIRPGQVKGFVLHKSYSDRLFFSLGTVKVVLYDDREGSPTRGKLNELFFSDESRGNLVIPPNVWHAVQNVGSTDALFVNCPTKPYNHKDPDKWALPKNNDVVPYSF